MGICKGRYIFYFLRIKLKVQKNHISNIKVFYNHKTISPIVQVKFDNKIVQELPDHYFYFFINCYQIDITIYVQKLQDTISYRENYIKWIQDNKVLKFYPELEVKKKLYEKFGINL